VFKFENFKSFAFKEYPSLAEKEEKFFPSFFSPFQVKISSKDWKQMEDFVKSAFQLRENKKYQNKILSDSPFSLHKHYSV
jgi:hypothetical protein